MRIAPTLRRAFLALFLSALAPAAAYSQVAAAFPDRPLRIIVPLAPGGLADISFRLVANKLAELLGKPVVVENLPGAGGVAAAQAALRAKPDGHTLLVITNGTSTSPSLFKNLGYDPVRDFAPVAFAAYFDLVVLANAEGRHRTLQDFVAAAKAEPGKLNIATVNPGSTQNLSAELFRSVAGIDAAVVPYRSSPEALNALLAGRVDVVFESYATARGLVDSGKLRPLASTAGKRSGYLPQVPSVREAGVAGFEVVGWEGLAAPAGTPPEVIALLNRHMNTIVAMPDFAKRMLELGTDAYAGTPQELGARLGSDIAKWAAVIRQAGIQPQ